MAEAAPAREARGDDASSRLVQCKHVGDFYLPAARALIGSLCRNFLDQMALTPTELLCSSRNHTRLEGAGNLLREVVERAGSMQARAAGEPSPNRIRDLNALIDQLRAATRDTEAKEPSIGLKPGGFVKAVAAIRAHAPPDAVPAKVGRMLTEYLANARTWSEKLERMIGVGQEAKGSPEFAFVDTMLAEMIASGAAQDSLFSRRINLENKIEDLIELYKAAYPTRRKEPATQLAADFNALLTAAEMPETKAAIETAIIQQIAGPGPMSSPELMLELKSTYGLLQRLRVGDKVIGGRRALEFIDKRMGKLLNEETIGDYIRGGGTVADRLISLLEIYAVTFGPNNKKTVEGLIQRYFTDEALERRLLTGEGSTPHKLKLLTGLHRAVVSAPLATQDKQAYAVKIVRMQTNFLTQSKFFAQLDKQNLSSGRKCAQLLQLCADGHFIPGDNLEKAKTLVKHYLARPDFKDKYLEGISPSKRQELTDTLKKQLAALGLPSPF
ncbi:MAG TPA: hypothetical protein VMB81_13910 [Candidatus Sulfotelmatobacter sp.]|nr:hypothetical protein [Candidatus Sulfotelmatobacter sp.]